VDRQTGELYDTIYSANFIVNVPNISKFNSECEMQ
jgi:hypothetical protein